MEISKHSLQRGYHVDSTSIIAIAAVAVAVLQRLAYATLLSFIAVVFRRIIGSCHYFCYDDIHYDDYDAGYYYHDKVLSL